MRRPARFLASLLLSFSIGLPAQEVTLNLKGVDIEALVQMVADVTHKNFVIDERVKGKVTVISNQAMDETALYNTFISVLSVHGYAAIPAGNVIKIVPEAIAKTAYTPVNSQASDDQIITQIIKVQHLKAGQLIPILRPLIPQQGHIASPPDSNLLIISDRAANVQRLLKIIKRIDIAPQNEIEVMMLSHASASDIVRILNGLKQQNLNKSPNQQQLIADERTNSILISGSKSERLKTKALISHLDTPLETVGNTQVIYLRYARATELADILKGMISPQKTQQRSANKTPLTANNNAAKLTIPTQVQADKATNSLIISAAPDVLQSLKSVITKLDIRRAQVLVEAIIVELSVNKSKELGVQWILDGSNSSSTPIGVVNFSNAGSGILDVASGLLNNTISTAGKGGVLGLGNYSADNRINFGVLLQALAADSEANILSTPSLVTLDNQEAEIHVGQNVPFVTGQYTNTGAASGATNPFQTIQRQDIGIKLRIKPQINEGSSILLEIEQEVSSLAASSVSTTDIVTDNRELRTTVMVEDGQMVILGGLMTEDLSDTEQKVPGLGDIPLLGKLFSSQNTRKSKRNLMIFLHPTILRDASAEQQVTHGKYKFMRQQQLKQKQNADLLLEEDNIPILPKLNELLSILPGEQQAIPMLLDN